MYYKGGNLLHTLRHVVGDDEKWLGILRGLNRQFWHQTVDTGQVEDYISQQSGIDCEKFFDQYLRSVKIPKLVYRVKDDQVSYRFENVVDGFAVPVLVRVNGQEVRITPNQETQVLQWSEPVETLVLDRNFYMDCEGE